MPGAQECAGEGRRAGSQQKEREIKEVPQADLKLLFVCEDLRGTSKLHTAGLHLKY